MADTLYLEVDKANGAILSYSNEQLQSPTSDFIEATEAELDYLNRLEANVLPAGQVTTLSDLNDYRAKVKKIAHIKFQIAQNEGKIARLRMQLAKGEAAASAAKASRDAIMAKAAADRNMSVPALESALAAFKARTEVPQTNSSKTREETAKIIGKMMAEAKRKNYR